MEPERLEHRVKKCVDCKDIKLGDIPLVTPEYRLRIEVKHTLCVPCYVKATIVYHAMLGREVDPQLNYEM